MIVILKISDDSWIKKVFEKLARYQGKKIDDAVANFLVEGSPLYINLYDFV